MGVADMRAQFNDVAPAGYQCQNALLWYDRTGGPEVAYMTFSGHGPTDADVFEVTSDPMPPNADVPAYIRATAAKLGAPPAAMAPPPIDEA
jgi:hypothetical protein